MGTPTDMEYLIPLLLVLLLVGGFIAFMVLNATRRGRRATRADEDGPPGIGRDSTPLGDTAEHADERSARAGLEDEDATPGKDRPRPESERLADRGF
jgi:hypothetical protein